MLITSVFRMAFILAASLTSGCILDTDKSEDSAPQPKLEIQSVHFLDRGDHTLNIGESLANPLVAQGTGTVSYTSSNENIVSVDSDGNLSVLDVGNVTITATVQADSTYDQASLSYQVQSPLVLNAWIGETDSDIYFDEHSLYRNFYFSDSPDCLDNSNNQCSPFNWHSGDSAITTTELNFNNSTNIHLVETGTHTTTTNRSLSSDSELSRYFGANSRYVEFNDQLFFINYPQSYVSRDGYSWKKLEINEYPSGKLFVFNEKLWALGVSAHNKPFQGAWTSTDGITWTHIVDNMPFEGKGIRSTVFLNKIWAYPTDDTTPYIWSSSNGIDWESHPNNLKFQQIGYPQVFDNKVFVKLTSDSFDTGTQQTFIWSSSDGVNFSKVTQLPDNSHLIKVSNDLVTIAVRTDDRKQQIWEANGDEPFKLVKDDTNNLGRAVSFKGKYYSYSPDETWISNDHLNFYQVTKPNIVPQGVDEGSLISFNGALHLTVFSGHRGDNMIWKTEGGVIWEQASEGDIDVNSNSYSAHLTEFKGQLWGHSDEYNGCISYSTDVYTWQRVLCISDIIETPRGDFVDLLDTQLISFNNKLWLIGTRYGSGYRNMEIWSSIDGATWTKNSTTPPISPRSSYGLTVHNNKLWIIGNNQRYFKTRDVWSSVDGENWMQVTPDAGFESKIHSALSHNGKLWVFCENNAWTSDHGENWTKVADISHLEVDINFHSQFASHDGLLWYIKNGQIWKSDDGIDWKHGFRMPIILE